MDLEETTERQIERLLARLHLPNRGPLTTYLRLRTTAGNRPGTRRLIATTVLALDESLRGKPIRNVTAHQLLEHQERMVRLYAALTIKTYSTYLRAFLKWLLDVDQLPRPLRHALHSPTARAKTPVPVTEAEYQSLILTNHHHPRNQAILALLWETGMRRGELVSLNIESIRFTDTQTGLITMPLDAKGLKTGPRSIPILQSVAHLRAWMGLHPSPGQPNAPLFPSRPTSLKLSHRRLSPGDLNRILHHWCQAAGIRHLNPHLFRHAKGTQMNRANWSEAKQCMYAGWSPNSTMPRYYQHLDQSDLVAQVRRDAGLDEHGIATKSTNIDDTALEAKLKRALQRLLLGPDS